jgi:hypothetical protein
MAATDPDVAALGRRVDELELDHTRWLALEAGRAESRVSLLLWALACLVGAAYFIGRVVRADRAPVTGTAVTS